MFNLFKKKKVKKFTTEELEAMGLTVTKVNRVKPNYSSTNGRRA